MITTRPLTQADRRFVVPTWVKSVSHGPQQCRRLLRATYGLAVDRILDDPATVGVVLCSEAATSALHGYAVAAHGVLHYAYMPPELRGQGLARKAIRAVLGDYPARIVTSHPWPWQSARFHWDYEPLARVCGHERAA